MDQKKLVVIASNCLITKGIAVNLVYVDSTKGWSNMLTDSGLQSESGNFYNSYRWNSNLNCGNFKIHTFTGPGTFCVSSRR